MKRRIRIFLNLLALGVAAENTRISGGGVYGYRTLTTNVINKAMT